MTTVIEKPGLSTETDQKQHKKIIFHFSNVGEVWISLTHGAVTNRGYLTTRFSQPLYGFRNIPLFQKVTKTSLGKKKVHSLLHCTDKSCFPSFQLRKLNCGRKVRTKIPARLMWSPDRSPRFPLQAPNNCPLCLTKGTKGSAALLKVEFH